MMLLEGPAVAITHEPRSRPSKFAAGPGAPPLSERSTMRTGDAGVASIVRSRALATQSQPVPETPVALSMSHWKIAPPRHVM